MDRPDLALLVGAVLAACGGSVAGGPAVGAFSASRPPAPSAGSGAAAISAAPPARVVAPPLSPPRFDVVSVTMQYGIMVKTRSGDEFMLETPSAWPNAVIEFRTGENALGHKFDDPFTGDLLASLRRTQPGGAVDGSLLATASRWLEVGGVVVDPDWSDLVLTKIQRGSATSFDVSLTKHGMVLAGIVSRPSTLVYGAGYEHRSRANIESREFGGEVADTLRRAAIGPGVSAALQAEMVALLVRPTVWTSAPSEP